MKERLRELVVKWLGGFYSEEKSELVSHNRVGPIMVDDLVNRLVDYIEIELRGKPDV